MVTQLACQKLNDADLDLGSSVLQENYILFSREDLQKVHRDESGQCGRMREHSFSNFKSDFDIKSTVSAIRCDF